jgi:hypothetical protein
VCVVVFNDFDFVCCCCCFVALLPGLILILLLPFVKNKMDPFLFLCFLDETKYSVYVFHFKFLVCFVMTFLCQSIRMYGCPSVSVLLSVHIA